MVIVQELLGPFSKAMARVSINEAITVARCILKPLSLQLQGVLFRWNVVQ
jgi:hypothetical protein